METGNERTELTSEWGETSNKRAKNGATCYGVFIKGEKQDREFLLAVVTSLERGGLMRGSPNRH